METTITATITAGPILASGAFISMGEHLLSTIDPRTACTERLIEVARQVRALAADAEALTGKEVRTRDLRDGAYALEDAAAMKA